MLARHRYPFLSWKGRAALLVLDALGTIGTALHGLAVLGPPRLPSTVQVGPIRSILVFGCLAIGDALTITPALRALRRRWLTRTGIADRALLVALAPGAGGSPHKRWPPAHFAHLGEGLARDLGATILVVVVPSERPAGGRQGMLNVVLSDPLGRAASAGVGPAPEKEGV